MMNKMLVRFSVACLVVVAPAGCRSVQNAFDAPTATVSISVKDRSVQVPVTVSRVMPNEHSVVGVKYIQTSSLEKAMRELEIGVREKPADWQARIALAAVQEAGGKLEEALQNYEQANLDKGGAVDLRCVDGLARIRLRLKR